MNFALSIDARRTVASIDNRFLELSLSLTRSFASFSLFSETTKPQGPLEPNDDAKEKEQARRRRCESVFLSALSIFFAQSLFSYSVDDVDDALLSPLSLSLSSISPSNSSGAAEAPSAPSNKPARPEGKTI